MSNLTTEEIIDILYHEKQNGNKTPWNVFEVHFKKDLRDKDWTDTEAADVLFRPDSFEVRLKRKTRVVHGKEVAAPFEPAHGEYYWYVGEYGTHAELEACCVRHSKADTRSCGINLFGKFCTREDLIENVIAYFPHLTEEDFK